MWFDASQGKNLQFEPELVATRQLFEQHALRVAEKKRTFDAVAQQLEEQLYVRLMAVVVCSIGWGFFSHMLQKVYQPEFVLDRLRIATAQADEDSDATQAKFMAQEMCKRVLFSCLYCC